MDVYGTMTDRVVFKIIPVTSLLCSVQLKFVWCNEFFFHAPKERGQGFCMSVYPIQAYMKIHLQADLTWMSSLKTASEEAQEWIVRTVN